MTVTSLEDLLHHELQETRRTEALILSVLPKLKQIDTSQAGALDAYGEQTRQRLKRLDQAGQAADGDPGEGLRLGVVTKIDDYISAVGNRDVLWAIAHSELLAARHYLLARYALVSSCADRLHRRDVAAVADLALNQERASLGATAGGRVDQEIDRYNGISMGERLTTFFERKK